eukprot:CAMPEP_0116127396 /NCGR_PEP_ID=MMETSP0329-20121206/6819_1 /TAXON_ID=697910 /ORGANISM="Pseudo-nitzschia arenysensis, Strain B593" /LENGTH=1017 /DNA_ID=CAMNT_0003621495 /DNA_START=179 /DNA_END=3232 /DNA_ORIENTATION=-
MAAESVYSGATGTDRTASMNSVTWKSGVTFGGKKKKKKGVSSGGSGNNTTSTGSTSAENKKIIRNIKVGRYVLVLVLLVSAALLGYFSYYLMDTAESNLAKNRFDSIVKRAEANAKWVVEQKKQASHSLANMYGTANPDASEWPFVHMEGYKEIASQLKLITQGSLSFCPIVIGYGEGSQQKEFEDYWYNLYEQWGYPNGTAESAFGRGIYGFGYDTVNYKLWPDYRYPVLTNYTAHGTPNPNNIMVPFVQSDFGNHSALMLDVQFEVNRFMTTQDVLDCAEERKNAQDKTMDCGSITDMIWQPTNAVDVKAGPTGILYSPIYPRNDPFEVTGFILHKQIWHDLLKHAFESDISGIRIVLHTDTGREHSYEVNNGDVYYVGNRTHHCIAFSDGDYVECSPDDEWVPFNDACYLNEDGSDFRALNLPLTQGVFSDETVNYYMDIYATDEFVSQFGRLMGSNNSDNGLPISIVVCIGTVLVMVFTSLLFVAYDYYVQKEFNAKNQLLAAKRRFVRFVSHEVRTPLNTVCMGLTLLESDLVGALEGSDLTKALKDSVQKDDRVGDDELVVKRESVEDWLSLSTQVFQNADAAVGVLSDLLNYDKIQMGTLSLELSLINLWATLETTVEEFQMAATEKTVNLTIDFSPLMKPGLLSAGGAGAAKTDLSVAKGGLEEAKPKSLKASGLPAEIQNCLVVADKIRLTQVFRNLISNGLKFSKPHTQMAVRISIDPFEANKQKQEKISLHKNVQAECLNIGTVTVEVIDQGVGMTEEQVDTVFEDGTQFDANKLQAGGGSGLGLNIARGIVLEHGGSLTCSSEGIGKGTTFTLRTNLYTDQNATPKASAKGEFAEVGNDEENAGDADFTVPLLHVLVVDDSLTNRKLCQRLLERNGHRTEGACNGNEAVEMVEKSMKTGRYYDAILMDYEMPIMNGPEACKLIRKMGCSSYIAGVTGNVMSEDVDHFRSCGANWVIPKPFSVKAMEDQWVEDGVTPFNENEESMVRVESSQGMIELGENFNTKMV